MRKSLIISVSLIFLTILMIEVKSQESDKYIDSLSTLLNKSEGENKVDILNNLSKASWNKSYKTSLEYSTLAYDLASRINYFEGMADATNRMGNVYFFLKDSTRALDFYRKSLELAQTTGDEKRKGMVYNNIGLLYASLRNHEKAIHYYKLGLESKIKEGNKQLISSSLANLGNSYYEIKNFSKSIDYFKQLINIHIETGDSSALAQGYEYYGNTYMMLSEFDKAFENHSKAYDIRTELNDSVGMLRSFFNVGQTLLRKNILTGARVHFKYVLETAQKNNNLELTRDVFNELSLLYEKEGSFKEAYNYHLQYSNLKDSILKRGSDKLLEELKVIYETEYTDHHAALLARENELQVNSLKQEKNLKNYVHIIVFLVLVIAFIIISKYYLKKGVNKKLEEKRESLEKANARLKESEDSLQELNVTKDKFFAIVAHDLKNPFNALVGFSEMLSENLDELSNEEITRYVEIIHQSAKNLYKLLENLLLWSASQTGNLGYAPENFDLRVLAQKELSQLKNPIQKKKLNIINKIAPGIVVYADMDLISNVFYNLLENAIKFSHEGESITLSAVALKKFAEISIADSGIGMTEEQIDQLFKLENNQNKPVEERGTGLGLVLCKHFIERNSGFIDVMSTINRGTTFIFSIPLAEKS